MFLRKLLLLDSDEERRRKHLRAWIIRRNRIKKEIEQGLEPSAHRRGYQPSTKDNSAFIPTFGGNSDQHGRSNDRYIAGTLRTSTRPVAREATPAGKHELSRRKQAHAEARDNTVESGIATEKIVGTVFVQQSSSTKDDAAKGYHSSLPAKPHRATLRSTVPGIAAPKQLPPISKAKARWQDAFHEVIFRRHEEILRKDPNRKWRQERFGLLLFDKKEYERAAKHLTLAITLGASSSACWRRLAQSHFHMWENKNDWDTLWDAKGAYEQAMNYLEIACNPFALFEYAKVLEVLGIYTGALSICASILHTFPRFQWLHRVMFRFVLLQRYQIFSTGGELLSGGGSSISLETMEAIEKESMLLKCVGYTKMLLLDKQIAEGELYVCVLYMHARLNELLAVSTTSAGGGQAGAKMAQESSDHSFEELFKVAIAKKLVVSTTPLSWKTWKVKSDTYIALAGYFHDRNEPIPAADALSRALDLLGVPLIQASTDARVDTSKQSRSKLSLYLELGRNYYQCNQMEKAIRSMEVVFQMNPFHEEARASLSAWFPEKWKYRLELEDASQVQIARVIRGIWGRNRAHRRRQEVLRALEMKYNENPYHPLHRRNVLRVLKTKYAPLFMAQDISARRIQARARRYLYYARIRWSLEDQRAKFLQQLKSKQQTRKYRYNHHVRKQLAQLLPEQFEDRFQQEDRATLYIQVPHTNVCHHTPTFGFGFDTNPFFVLPMLPQRRFRGKRVRCAFRVRRDARRSKLRQENEAAHCIQRFYHRHCHRQTSSDKLSPEELLYCAHQKIAQARERITRNLQQLYRRRWKSVSSPQRLPSLFEASQQNAEKKIIHRHTSAIVIQRAWRRHVAQKELGFRGFDGAKVLVQQLKRGHERQRIATEDDLELAVRKIQALYRGKRIRNSLCKIRRVFAPVSESTISSLIDSCESNCHEGVESCVTLHRVQSLEEKRALFDYPVVILDPPATSSTGDISTEVAPFPLQHLVAAIEHSARLRCLVCASGDFQGDRIGLLFSSLKNSRSLQALALGRIQTDNFFTKERETPSEQHDRQVTPEDDDDGVDGDLELPSHDIVSSQPISQHRVSHQPLNASKQSPIQSLSQVLRTTNFMLEELYMEDNTLLRDPTEGSCVAGFLGDFFFARYGRLKKLVLAKMHFSDTNGALLGPALAINTVLQHLDLHGNLIGDNGAASIASHGLAHNRTLTYLNLAENVIGSPGAKALFECLTHRNQTLVTLVLCNNNVLNDAIPAFTDAWQLNPTILHIDLRGNLINNDHLDAVHEAVQERCALSSSESELRLFLARKRFSLTLGPSATSRAQSPLKSISTSSSNSKKGKCPAKLALSPTAFLRQAKQNNSAGMRATAAFIRSPLAVYKQQQQIEYSSYNHKHDSTNSTAVSPAVSVASASVLALVSPARTAAPSSSSRKTKPARYETKLPAIHHHAINCKSFLSPKATRDAFAISKQQKQKQKQNAQEAPSLLLSLFTMELSSGESALRTIKNRSKVPQAALDLCTSISVLLFGKQQNQQLVLKTPPSDEQEDDDINVLMSPEQKRELLEQKITTLLFYGKERWEPLAVACVVVRDVLAAHLKLSDDEAHIEKVFVGELNKVSDVATAIFPFTESFLKEVVASTAHQYIEHYEPRVRMSVGKLLGVLANWDLAWVNAEFVPQIIESVVCNTSRSPDFEENGFEDVDDNISVNGMETPPQSPESTPRTPSTPYRLDDVSGWKALESSLCALKFIVKGSGAAFLEKEAGGQPDAFRYLTPELMELITTKSCFHINRHVRVVGLDTITELCEAAPVGFLDMHRSISDTLCKCITRGMQDNWSQVRYAASIATRAFLVKLQEEARSIYLPTLVPRLCLNRYYVAERVSKHSQETWRLLMGTRGRDVVAKYANEIVEYYVEMTNHSVREAACQCIGELGTKVDAEAIRPHVPTLVQALIISLYDNSWQVRDVACLAAAQMALGFPNECLPFLDELYHLWFDHLSDEIWSVREDAAIALGNAIRAYGQPAVDRVSVIVEEYIVLAKTQPAMSQQEYDEILKSEKKHHSKQAFSCCSFDFKTNERHEHRTKEPWESTDGAIYLVRELCQVAPDVAIKLLPLVADIAILRHFPQTGVLQETVWKQVPLMCEALGKRVFKQYLELFFDPLVFTLQGSYRLARFAAKDCVANLSKQIGPSIFLGRLQANLTWQETLAPIISAPVYH